MTDVSYHADIPWSSIDPRPTHSKTIEEIADFCQTSIQWRSDQDNYGVADYWATPQETFDRKSGDCDDKAILFLYLVHEYMGVDGYLVKEFNQTDYTDGHMIAEVNGITYLQYPGIGWVEMNRWTYANAIWLAETFHNDK
jgi:hypothetical protein